MVSSTPAAPATQHAAEAGGAVLAARITKQGSDHGHGGCLSAVETKPSKESDDGRGRLMTEEKRAGRGAPGRLGPRLVATASNGSACK